MSGVAPLALAGMSQPPLTTQMKRLESWKQSFLSCQDYSHWWWDVLPRVHQVAVQVKPVYAPPQLFPIGKETITYIATDHSGNQANCSFAITVVGEFISSALLDVWALCLIPGQIKVFISGIFYSQSRLRNFSTQLSCTNKYFEHLNIK